MATGSAPIEEYRRRLKERERRLTDFARWEANVANARLAVFVTGVLMTWLALGAHLVHPVWIIMPFFAFAVLIVVHERVLRSIRRAKSGADYYRWGIARIEDRWTGTGWDGSDLAPEEHPYAQDLDIFGRGSLFQLLCTAQTRTGAKTLADWLCAPASPQEIRARQASVEELRYRIDLREEIAYEGRRMASRVVPQAITAWASAQAVFASRWLPAVAFAASLVAALAGAGLLFGAPPWPLSLAGIGLVALHMVVRKKVCEVMSAAEEPSRELDVVGHVLARLERESFEHPYLQELKQGIKEGPVRASVAIAHLRRLLILREASFNMIFGPLAAVLMWDYHFARAVDAWRYRHGAAIDRWLESVGRLEALCALASYTYEHPEDPFPDIVEEGPVVRAQGLAHPLLPAARCVRNDVVLDEGVRLLIISGSNMSGKTVLLRTVGINIILGSAGAPVRAQALSFSPLAVGATISIHDALQAGVSRFYAEITRIRSLMDIAQGPIPLLFLLDEIFHGTNSWDRRIGARAVLRGFVQAGAIGLVTTHDLAVTELESEFGEKAVNVHFEDHVENDRLAFDYQLRPGVANKSNALALMRAIGLNVE